MLTYTIPHTDNELGALTGNGMEVPDNSAYASRDWPEREKNFAAMVTRMDSDIGRLMAQLAESRLTAIRWSFSPVITDRMKREDTIRTSLTAVDRSTELDLPPAGYFFFLKNHRVANSDGKKVVYKKPSSLRENRQSFQGNHFLWEQ
jgi:hypothetical protein